jgi:hypothetical protein
MHLLSLILAWVCRTLGLLAMPRSRRALTWALVPCYEGPAFGKQMVSGTVATGWMTDFSVLQPCAATDSRCAYGAEVGYAPATVSRPYWPDQ